MSRSPLGERELKLISSGAGVQSVGRSPLGERELKPVTAQLFSERGIVAPRSGSVS